MNANRKIKGFVFTLDAVFALVVAAIGTSILLYVDFTGVGAYGIAAGQAPAILQTLLRTSLTSASSGSVFANYLSASAYAAVFPWRQAAHDGSLSSGTGYSLQSPYLLYTFSVPPGQLVLPAASADSGVVAIAAANILYVINATTGVQQFSFGAGTGTPSNIVSSTAIYRNVVYYANVNNVIRGISISNGSLKWSFNASNSITTPIEVLNNYISFGTSNGFYLLNPVSGALVSFAPLGLQAQMPTYEYGEYIIPTASQTKQNYLYSYSLFGGTLASVWNAPLTSNSGSNSVITTNPSSINNTVAVGSGNYLYIFSLGGSKVYSSNDLHSRALGIGGYGNNYYVQTVNGLYSFTTTGNSVFANNTVVNSQNSIPSIGLSTVYASINANMVVAYNWTTASYIFNISMPSNYIYSSYSNPTLAYGNMYVPSGNTLYAFGTYKPQPGDSLLQAIAGMYLNGQGGYAGLLLQSIYNSSNIGIFINSTQRGSAYAPSLSVATFNSIAKSYIRQSTGWHWMSNSKQNFSMSLWLNTTSSNEIVLQEMPTGTSFIEIANDIAYARVGGMSCVRLGSISLNKWTNIAFAYSGNSNTLTGYINGIATNSMSMASNRVVSSNSYVYYLLGAAGTSSCGSGGGSYNGMMLDYQAYNTTLGAQQVSSLYSAGAFAQPIGNAGEVLWMPLVGNPNDYSGGFDFGIPYSMNYGAGGYMPQSLLNSYQVNKASVPMFLNVNGTYRQYSVSVVEWR